MCGKRLALLIAGLLLAGAVHATPPTIAVNSPLGAAGASVDVLVSFSNSTGATPRSAGFQFRLGFDSSKLSPGNVTSTLSGVGCNSAGAGVLSCGGFAPSGEYPASGTVTISMGIAPSATGVSPLQLSNHEQFDTLGNSIPGTNPDPADGILTVAVGPVMAPTISVNSPSAAAGAAANVVVSFNNSTGSTPRSAGFQFRLGFDSSKLSPGTVTSTLSGVACSSIAQGVLSCGGFAPSGEYPGSGTMTVSMGIAPSATGSSPLELSNHQQFDTSGNNILGTEPDPEDGILTIVPAPGTAPMISVNSPSAPAGETANVVISFSNSTGSTPRSAGFQFRLGFDSSKLSPGNVTSTLSGVTCGSVAQGVLSCGGFAQSGVYPDAGMVTVAMGIAASATGSSPLQLSDHQQFDTLGNNIPGTNPDPADGLFEILQGSAAPVLSYSPAVGQTVTLSGGAGQIIATPTGGFGSGTAATTSLSGCAVSNVSAGGSFGNVGGVNLLFVGDNAAPAAVVLSCTQATVVTSAVLSCDESRAGAPVIRRDWPLLCPAVLPPPELSLFEAAPTVTEPGGTVQLAWASTYQRCLARRGAGTSWAGAPPLPPSGSASVTMPALAGDYDFGLICETAGSSSVEAVVQVSVVSINQLLLDLTAPSSAPLSSEFSLSWASNLGPAGTCQPEGGLGTSWASASALPTSGIRLLQAPNVASNVSFGLTCLENGQSVSASAVVVFEAPVPPPPSGTPRGISVSLDGSAANGASGRSDLSRDGSVVVFDSLSSDISAELPDGGVFIAPPDSSSVFIDVRGRSRAVIASVDEAGQPLPSSASSARVSGERAANGLPLAVVFESGDGQVRLFSGDAGTSRIASANAQGIPANGASRHPDVSEDGSLLVFDSSATNLTVGDINGRDDVFIKDAETGEVDAISTGPSGEPANGHSRRPVVSGDGTTVYYETQATNVDPSASVSAGRWRICAARICGTCRSYCIVANADILNIAVNKTGEFGAFESDASNLDPTGDANGVRDVFWFRRDGERIVEVRRISKTQDGIEANGPSRNPSISDDGYVVVFESDASNLVLPDVNQKADIYQKFVQSGVVQRVVRTSAGDQGNGDSIEPEVSGDGSTIGFSSEADNLLPDDTNGVQDVLAVNNTLVANSDEPALQRAGLPMPNPPNASCPGGFFVARVEDGPVPGVSNGTFGLEVLLDTPGTRVLAGGLNFGGLVDVSQRGFAAVNIANSRNENQRLNVSLTGNPSSSPSSTLPVRVIIERRSGGGSVEVFRTDIALSGTQAFETSVVVPPGFYVASVAPLGFGPEAAGGEPEGRFLFSLTTRFVDRAGGGFQGGAVVGGYHAISPFGGSSGFAAFCIASPHSTTTRVFSAPTYGARGARDLRLRVFDGQQNVIYSVP
jgi:Tol biopolymer transport system component